jgi:hypothetical protein
MNPATITERLDQEVRWLSDNSIINQPLKTDNHAIRKSYPSLIIVYQRTDPFPTSQSKCVLWWWLWKEQRAISMSEKVLNQPDRTV